MLHKLETRKIETLELSPMGLQGWTHDQIAGLVVKFERSRIPILVWDNLVIKGNQRIHAVKIMGGHSVRVLDLRTCCPLDVYNRFEVVHYFIGVDKLSLFKLIGKVRGEEYFEECVTNLNKTSAIAAIQFLNNHLKERGTYEPV